MNSTFQHENFIGVQTYQLFLTQPLNFNWESCIMN